MLIAVNALAGAICCLAGTAIVLQLIEYVQGLLMVIAMLSAQFRATLLTASVAAGGIAGLTLPALRAGWRSHAGLTGSSVVAITVGLCVSGIILLAERPSDVIHATPNPPAVALVLFGFALSLGAMAIASGLPHQPCIDNPPPASAE
jgi:hypothetical protein